MRHGKGNTLSFGGKSARRNVSGNAQLVDGEEVPVKGKESKNTILNRSASRNAGAAIVNLKDYKNEKEDGKTNSSITDRKKANSEHNSFNARNPNCPKASLTPDQKVKLD